MAGGSWSATVIGPTSTPFIDRPVVLLDLDGTLVDSLPDVTVAVNLVLAHEELPPLREQEVRAMIGDGAAVLVRRAFAGRNAAAPADGLARFRAAYDRRCLEKTVAYAGVPELLQRLDDAGRRLAVVTNKPADFACKVLEALDLRRHLDLVLGPEDVARRKPDPEHVAVALATLGARADEAVMVGDGTTDVAAGRDAGCATIAVLWGYRSREQLADEHPDAFASTPEDLERLLLP